MREKAEIEFEKLHQAYRIAAKVVTMYGDAYLPVFERMHFELQTYKSKLDKKDLARRIAIEDNGLTAKDGIHYSIQMGIHS